MGKRSKRKKGGKTYNIPVFVYGTLKQGLGNHWLLEGNSVRVGYDSLVGKFVMKNMMGIPGVIHSTFFDASNTVFGELYFTDEKTLEALDRLEGHPEWYERQKHTTAVTNTEAWVYLQPHRNNSRYNDVENFIYRPQTPELEYWLEKGCNLKEQSA